jgi:quinol monooxygenase YgiN
MKKIILPVLCCSLLMLASCCPSGTQNSEKQCGKSQAVQLTGNELIIIANVIADPEYKDELVKAFKAVVDGTRKEPGNISYDLLEDVANPLRFTFVEAWKSQEAIEAHNSSPHFQEFVKAIEGKAQLEVFNLKKKF